jgi:hypothetical protein
LSQFKIGDRVIFLSAPEWLLKGLPTDEQGQIRSFVGQTAEITEVDEFGYFWIGFGSQIDRGDESQYVGHSFAVTADYLKAAG